MNPNLTRCRLQNSSHFLVYSQSSHLYHHSILTVSDFNFVLILTFYIVYCLFACLFQQNSELMDPVETHIVGIAL